MKTNLIEGRVVGALLVESREFDSEADGKEAGNCEQYTKIHPTSQLSSDAASLCIQDHCRIRMVGCLYSVQQFLSLWPSSRIHGVIQAAFNSSYESVAEVAKLMQGRRRKSEMVPRLEENETQAMMSK